MDVSECLRLLAPMVVPVVAWAVFRIGKRVKRRWLRLPIRAVASAAGSVSAVIVLLLFLAETGCTKHPPPIESPDGHYVAILSYALQGALGADYADVNVRPWWRPYARNVYSGLGSWDFKNGKPSDPEVRWLDRSHLLIRYRDDRTGNEGRGGPALCRSRMDGIQIVCQQIH